MTQIYLGSLTSVCQAAEHFFTRWSKLDVLINNAAIAVTPLGYTVDGYEGSRTGLVEAACYVAKSKGKRLEPRDPQQRTGDSKMTERIAGASPRQLARIAGALYLINIVAGAFAIGIVPAMLVVSGDAAATANNIQTHELLYRLSLVAHVVVTVTSSND